MLAFFVLFGSVGLGVIVFRNVSPAPPASPARPVTRLPENVDMSLQKIRFTETKDGVEKWELVADRADYDRDKDLAHLVGIKLRLPGDKKSGMITLTADRADYHAIRRDVRLQGDVRAHSVSGMRFETGEAVFDAVRDVIRAPGRVSFVEDRMSVEGNGMELETIGRKVRISSGVTATIVPGGRLR
jgi:LPS export ABC transporter protein LptC